MDYLKKLEVILAKLMKGLPALPKDVRGKVVSALPWVALIFSFLELILIWGLLDFINKYREYGEILTVYGVALTNVLSSFDKMIIYLGMGVLIVSAVIGLLAYVPLKERKPKGWYLLFLAVTINLGYAVLSLFLAGQGFGSFFISTLQSAFGFYLLLQVRDYYKSSTKPKSTKAE